MRDGCNQRALRSDDARRCDAEKQEANVFGRGKHQQALEAALRKHEQCSQKRSEHGSVEQRRLRREQARNRLRSEEEFAEGGHIDDGDDDAEHQRRNLIGQLKQPEEERHRRQLDRNAGQQERTRPFRIAAICQHVACDHRSSGDENHSEISKLCRLRTCGPPNQHHRQQRAKLQQAEASPCVHHEKTIDC